MTDAFVIIVVALTFFIAGGIKGVVGLGLPTFSLALLVMVFDLATAIVITLIPSLVTNTWQALSGTNTRITLKRIFPFLLMALLTIWLGAYSLSTLDNHLLTLLLGSLLIAYAIINLSGIHFSIPERHYRWSGMSLGLINGVLTGMAGVYIIPSVMYFQAIGMRRDDMVTAMGLLFSLSSISMLFAYQYQGLLDLQHAMLSLFAVIPALLGMQLGTHVRRRLPESMFKQLLFLSLLLLGIIIIIKSILISPV